MGNSRQKEPPTGMSTAKIPFSYSIYLCIYSKVNKKKDLNL